MTGSESRLTVLEQINRPGVSLAEIMDIIESREEPDSFTRLAEAVNNLFSELQEIYRPRVFFNIVPDSIALHKYSRLANPLASNCFGAIIEWQMVQQLVRVG